MYEEEICATDFSFHEQTPPLIGTDVESPQRSNAVKPKSLANANAYSLSRAPRNVQNIAFQMQSLKPRQHSRKPTSPVHSTTAHLGRNTNHEVLFERLDLHARVF